MPHAYPDDDEFAAVYIAAHDAALPAATLGNAGHPRHWALAAHAARAAGLACVRCGQPIAASHDVRRRADGDWVHESCPLRAAAAGQ